MLQGVGGKGWKCTKHKYLKLLENLGNMIALPILRFVFDGIQIDGIHYELVYNTAFNTKMMGSKPMHKLNEHVDGLHGGPAFPPTLNSKLINFEHICELHLHHYDFDNLYAMFHHPCYDKFFSFNDGLCNLERIA